MIEPRDYRRQGSDDQRSNTTHADVHPEQIGHLRVRDLLPLHRRCREPGILKHEEKTGDCGDHGIEAEIPGCEQARHHHDGREVQQELGSLGRDCDKSSRNRPALEIAHQVISAKMFLIRIDRFARPVSFDFFRSSHANQHILGVSNTGTVVSHDSPICESSSSLDARC